MRVARSVDALVDAWRTTTVGSGRRRSKCRLRRLQRRPNLRGDRLEFGGRRHWAARRLQRDAVPAWQDVEVQVEHQLSAGLLIELLHRDAIGGERAFCGDRQTLDGGDEVARAAGGMSNSLRAATLGMTNAWPGERGMMSMKARVASSSKIRPLGISPRRILAKMLLGS